MEAAPLAAPARADARDDAKLVVESRRCAAGRRHSGRRLGHGRLSLRAEANVQAWASEDRPRIAFIDDRLDNLRDLLAARLGLAMHAPSYLTMDRQFLMTFNISDALAAIQSWHLSARQLTIVSLSPRPPATLLWCHTGPLASRVGWATSCRLVFLERLQ